MRRSARACALLAAVAAVQPGYATARSPDEPARRLSFSSSFTAETPVEMTQTPAPMAGAVTGPAVMGNSVPLTTASTQMVSGLVESFLHSEPLQPGELQCLSDGSGQLAGDLSSVTSQMIGVMDQVMGGKTGMADANDPQFAAGAAPQPVTGQQSLGSGADDIAAKVNSMFASNSNPSSSTGAASSSAPALPSGFSGAAAPAPASTATAQRLPQVQQTPAPTPSPEKTSASMNLFYGSRRLQAPTSVEDTGAGSGMNPNAMMSAPALMMEFGWNMKQIMDLSHSMVQKCVHGDALKALDEAAAHMQNLEYVSGHFMANGQDVLSELSEAAMDYKKGDAKGFGQNFGKAARKVLLSDAGSNSLPEGLPGKEVMTNVSTGLVDGLFGNGAAVNLKIPGDVDHAPETVHVDLHQCVDKNLPFFQSAFAELNFFMAQKDAKVLKSKDKMQWGTAVAFTMFQAPQALKKCGITPEQEQMLKDSIRSLGEGGDVDVDLDLPKVQSVNKDQAELEFAQATKDWADMKWTTFGHDMGMILQQAGAKLNQKYYIGPNGGLQMKKSLIALEAARTKSTVSGLSLLAICGLASVAAVPLLGALGLRMQRALRNSAYDHNERLYLHSEGDVESGCEDSQAVE